MKKYMDYLEEDLEELENPDYSDPQVLKAMVTENFTAIAKGLKGMKQRRNSFHALLDFDKPRLRRRMDAVFTTCTRLRKETAGICPDIPGVFSIEEEWAKINSTPVTSPDLQEDALLLSAGAAIWILDRIRESGKLPEALRLLPRGAEAPVVGMPELWDACYSREVLRGMISVLQNRNLDCMLQDPRIPRKKKAEPGELRIFMDRYTTAGTHRQQTASRMRFESILALVPESDRKAAACHYEQKLWEWVRRYYQCRAIFAAREQKMAKNFDRFYNKTMHVAKEHRDVIVRGRAAPAVLQTGLDPTALPGMVAGVLRSTGLPLTRAADSEDLVGQIKELGAEMSRLDSQLDSLADEINDFIFDSISNCAEPAGVLEEAYGSEISAILTGFTVDDPYELCFAVLYLLDQGSELPWLYYPSCNLMEYVGRCLPWGNEGYEEESDEIWNASQLSLDAGILRPRKGSRRGRKPEMPDWYALEYVTRSTEAAMPKRTNLSQVVYNLTGGIMPREMHRYDELLGVLADYGITGRKAIMVLSCMLLMGEARRQAVQEAAPEEPPEAAPEELPEEAKPENVGETVEQLRTAAAALKQENSRLKHAVYSAEREAAEQKKQYEALEERVRLERRELAELRELVFYQKNEIEPPIDAGIDLPYTVRRRTVVFGGHDSWARAIKPMLKGDIRFIDRNMLPNADLIRHADMVWLQTNSLSHKFYSKIMDVVRNYGIPLHYFKYASAEKCAEQVIIEDMA